MIAVEGDFEVGFCWDFERGKRERGRGERETEMRERGTGNGETGV